MKNFKNLDFVNILSLNKLVLVNPVARGSFEAEVDYLKEYIQKRFDITDEIVRNASFETVTKEVEKRKHHHRDDFRKPKINNFLLKQED